MNLVLFLNLVLKSALTIDKNGTIESNHKIIAVKFNDCFTNNAKKLLKNMGETNSKIQDYLKNPNEHNLLMKETDPQEEEVNKYLNNLDMKKANDIYGISPKLIKIGASKPKLRIAFISNQCLI